MNEAYYVTTPIYYVNDHPHLGHLYTTIAADTLARYHRSRGAQVFFLTGTDEHGQKIEEAAAARGMGPKALADEVVERFRALWARYEVSHDDFIRTTEARHRDVVTRIWKRMEAAGDIYLGEYEDWYCVACEAYYPETQLTSAENGPPHCPVHLTPVRRLKEASYFFRLSRYREALLRHIDANPDFIAPVERKNEIVSFVRSGLRDLSVSRSTFRWGIPVPGDPAHVIYVWIDALTNYVSACGLPDDENPRFRQFWPADLHLIGKDILRFHAVYWPCMLFSAGLPPPRRVFAHGWWTVEGQKMSKTLRNAVDPVLLADLYGVDPVRYFLLREVHFGMDGDFSHRSVVARINAELANDLGNLLNRTVSMAHRYADGRLPAPGSGALADLADRTIAAYVAAMERQDFTAAIESVLGAVRAGNKFVDETAPWHLVKTDRDRVSTILATLCEVLRVAAACLSPILPGKMVEVGKQLGLDGEALRLAGLAYRGDASFTLGPAVPLFPRLELEKVLAEVKERAGETAAAPPAQAPQPAPSPVPAAALKPEISFDDFGRVDLRVGLVVAAERVMKSNKLLRLMVDLGEGEPRQIVAGIGKVYGPEEMVGKRIAVVANLKPATLMGVESRGMLLASGGETNLRVVTFDGEVAPGTPVK